MAVGRQAGGKLLLLPGLGPHSARALSSSDLSAKDDPHPVLVLVGLAEAAIAGRVGLQTGRHPGRRLVLRHAGRHVWIVVPGRLPGLWARRGHHWCSVGRTGGGQ